jgi:CelD/BcsL family acetyltransferase involved in cellulose biosynthesis
MTLEIVRVTRVEALREHCDAWNALAFRDGVSPNPYNTYPWVVSFLEHGLAPGRRFTCFLAYDGGRLEGVLPVVARPHRIFGAFRPVLEAPVDRHTVSIDCVVRPERGRQTAAALLDDVRSAFGTYHHLGFKRIDEGSPLRGGLEGLRTRLIQVEEYDGAGSYLETLGRFDDFLKSLSQKFRANLRNAINRIRKHGDVSYQSLGSDAVEDAHVTAFLTIESSGWKGAEGSAIASDAARERFYRSAIARFREAGALRIHLLGVEGRTIAALFVVTIGRTMFLCKIGYDEGYARCSPGTLLFERTFREAFDDPKIDRADCLTDYDYLQSWEPAQRRYFNVRFYPRSALSLALGYLPDRARLSVKNVPLARGLVQAVRARLRHSSPASR